MKKTHILFQYGIRGSSTIECIKTTACAVCACYQTSIYRSKAVTKYFIEMDN